MASSIADSTSVDTFYSLLQSIGWELTIFVATFVCALILHKASSRQSGKVKRASPANSPAPAALSPSGHLKEPALNRNRKNESISGYETSTARNSQQMRGAHQEYRRQRGPRDLARIIDEAMDNVHNQPSIRAAHRILALYTEYPECASVAKTGQTRASAVDLYTVLVQSAIRVGKHHLLDGIMDDMSTRGVARTLNVYETAMKQLAGQKQYHLALSMYDRLAADGLEPSAVTFSCLINFAFEVGELHRAIHFFEKLSASTTPSIRAYMSVLRVHAKRQDWPASLALLQDMKQRGVHVDSLALNIALATGVAAEQIEAVEEVLKEAAESDPPIGDTVSYNTLLKGYAQRNDATNALRLLDSMCTRGLKPNAITYNTAMDAVVRGSDMNEAWNVLKKMKSAGFAADKFTCSILIKSLTRNPTKQRVEGCLELLHEAGSVCDATLRTSLYQSLLEAAAQVADEGLMMEVSAQMRRWKVQVTPNTYRGLTQTLSQQGNTSCCSAICEQMLSGDVRPHASVFINMLDAQLKKADIESAWKLYECLRSSLKNDTNSKRLADSTALLDECRTAFLRSLCRQERVDDAMKVYDQACADGAAERVDSIVAMQLAKLQVDSCRLAEAWTTIDKMMKIGHKPSDSIVQAFLLACTKQANTALPEALLRKAREQRLQISQSSQVLILKLYGENAKLDEALELFQDMTEKQGMEPSSQTCAAVMNACVECQQPNRALELLLQLPARCVIGAEIPQKSFDVLNAAAAARGEAGKAQMQRLREIANAQRLTLK